VTYFTVTASPLCVRVSLFGLLYKLYWFNVVNLVKLKWGGEFSAGEMSAARGVLSYKNRPGHVCPPGHLCTRVTSKVEMYAGANFLYYPD